MSEKADAYVRLVRARERFAALIARNDPDREAARRELEAAIKAAEVHVPRE